ncbi:MAG: glucosyl-3-phosphoglycerate synthase [Solirubrobacteraceae bacterium]|nr:glucosyl-3-phosphoglycerate synthase [Solirubrobacteraceae bacterium]
MALSTVVVIPARDEEATIAACLQSLAVQSIGRQHFEIILVLDDCRDDTATVAAGSAVELGLALDTLTGPGQGAGPARRLGMETAATRLLTAGLPDGLIACTDADSRPAPDWLERQLAHLHGGARAIAGLIEIEPAELDLLPGSVRRRRERDAADRLSRVRRADPTAGHHHFAGASLGVTASTYRAVGGLEPLSALEDQAFAGRLDAHGVPILRASDVRVHTSARSRGRVSRGLSIDLEVSSWRDRRRYRAADFSAPALASGKGETTVSVIIPTKRCATTIGAIIRETVKPLAEHGLVDELLVIDADSSDGTAARAQAAGARVLQQDEVLPERGPALGKGDAMWRALSVARGELICFLDGDTEDPHPHHLQGLVGPLLAHPELTLVKGAFERPLARGAQAMPHEGGRVTELMARPLLNLHEPRLAGFAQPLAGEFGARRDLLEAIPFPVGYGVEIAVLVDALRHAGLDALAECDLGRRQNRHQSLRALGEMAYAVLAAMERRLPAGRSVIAGAYLRPWEDGRVVSVPVLERPPLTSLARRRGLSAGVN